jgi:hypothetical protein
MSEPVSPRVTYTSKCGLCNHESPHCASSEILERYVIEHAAEHGPEHEADVRRSALEGMWRDMSTVDGPHVVEDEGSDDE